MEQTKLDQKLEKIRVMKEKEGRGESCYSIAERHMKRLLLTNEEVYQKIGMDRRRWSDFKQNGTISQENLLKLCIVLKLDIRKAYYLMAFAKKTFRIWEETDELVKYCLETEKFEPLEVNRVFVENGCEPLFKGGDYGTEK